MSKGAGIAGAKQLSSKRARRIPASFDEALIQSFVRSGSVVVGARSRSSLLDGVQQQHPSVHVIAVDLQDMSGLSAILERRGVRHVHLLSGPADAATEVVAGAGPHLRHSRIDALAFDDVVNADQMRIIQRAVTPFSYQSFGWSEAGMIPSAAWQDDAPPRAIVAVHQRLLPLLLGLPKRMLNIGALCKHFGITPRGAIHVGAHEGREWSTYRELGISHAIFVEANPMVFERLRNNLGGETGVLLVNCAVTDRTAPIMLHVTSQDQSSSILRLKRHADLYPDIVETASVEVPGKTLDNLMCDLGVTAERFNFLNIDIQGAELKALQSGHKTLRHIEAINLEVNFEELYEGCAQIEEIDDFLASMGFRRVAITCPYHSSWGDAFYIRSAEKSIPLA